MKYTEEQVFDIQKRIKILQDELNNLSSQLNNSTNNNERIEELYSFNIPYNPNLTKGDRYYIGVNCSECLSNLDYIFCPVIYSGKSPVNPNSYIFETLKTFYIKGEEVIQNGKYLQRTEINKIDPITYNIDNPKFSNLLNDLSNKSFKSKFYLIKDELSSLIPSIIQTSDFEKYWNLISHIPITLEKKLYHYPNDFLTF
jgi:hypothetical protein